MPGKVLIAGASGLVGTACVEKFARDGWDVVAVSRRRPEVVGESRMRHVPIDLRNASDCRGAAAELTDITHVVYAAVDEQPGLASGWTDPEHMKLNLAMLQNLLDPLLDAAPGIEHVSILQGTKAYGAHLHPVPVPARERSPRDPHENFYWLHEDYVRERSAGREWTFTIMRPVIILGPNHGVAMNLIPVIGVYAAICRELGRPFSFPGGPVIVQQAVDCRLVADALAWAATSPAAAGETFNLTNGEVFAWPSIWPAIAEAVGLPVGPDTPMSLVAFLAEHEDVWDRIVAEHGLRPIGLAQLLGESHHYADRCLAYSRVAPPQPLCVSTVKIKQAGFTETFDTEETFRYWLHELGERQVIPRVERSRSS